MRALRGALRVALAAGLTLLATMQTLAQTEEPWSVDGLHGTFTQPGGDSTRGPAVLILAGSGPTDRNGNGPASSTDTLRLLAAGLAQSGIRSFRYDKRGIAESRVVGQREEDLTFDTFVGDALVIAGAMQARPDVSSVVIAGHSEGAIIAIAVAARKELPGIMLLAAPGQSFLGILRDQIRGRAPPDIDARATEIMDALERGDRIADIPQPLMVLFRPSVQPFLISTGKYVPERMLTELKVPVLIMHAERDIQVPRSELERLRKARPDARVVLLPEANHPLKVSPADLAGNLALYKNPSAPLDPGVIPPLVDFVRAVAR